MTTNSAPASLDPSPALTTGSATYCPEDNKLRLYVGRVSRPEFLKLRAEGWTCTPKQRDAGGCDFVAHWTPERRDTALAFGEGFIGDEDQSPADRAADRAERFAGYREKRTEDAVGRADGFDAGPAAHGFQSLARAERSASRHDRIAGRAVDAWDKAEYWQRRTSGVISHALHVSHPSVRMGRIKDLEADIRRVEKDRAEYSARFDLWSACAAIADLPKQIHVARTLAELERGHYTHPRTGKVTYLFAHARSDEERNADPLDGAELCALWFSCHGPIAPEGPWLSHYRLRLAYEHQMLEAQGGRAAFVEMVAGGFIGGHQIRKVNKSPATGRTVSVTVAAPTRASFDRKGKPYGENNPPPLTFRVIAVERMSPDAYRAPTDDERAALSAKVGGEKARAKAAKLPCPLVNPTELDALRLVAVWNAPRQAEWERRVAESMRSFYPFKPCEVIHLSQERYSAVAKGAHARAETKSVHALGMPEEQTCFTDYAGQARRAAERGPGLCTVRTTGFDPRHVIVITDKPQKPLPASVWLPFAPPVTSPAVALEPETVTA